MHEGDPKMMSPVASNTCDGVVIKNDMWSSEWPGVNKHLMVKSGKMNCWFGNKGSTLRPVSSTCYSGLLLVKSL
jgi:hypothetical protein